MTTDSRTFQFVQQLAANLKPDLDLPAFPQVVRRLQIALVSDQTTIKDIVDIVSSEPVLSARFMQMANSAAMNPNGTPVASLEQCRESAGLQPGADGVHRLRTPATQPRQFTECDPAGSGTGLEDQQRGGVHLLRRCQAGLRPPARRSDDGRAAACHRPAVHHACTPTRTIRRMRDDPALRRDAGDLAAGHRQGNSRGLGPAPAHLRCRGEPGLPARRRVRRSGTAHATAVRGEAAPPARRRTRIARSGTPTRSSC